MRLVGDAVHYLHRTHVAQYRLELVPGHLGLRRHITEFPMVLAHALFHGTRERCVGVVARVVDRMDERWSLVVPAASLPWHWAQFAS